MNHIKQGETFSKDYTLSGDDVTGFTYDLTVMQYPGDTPAITRTLTIADGVVNPDLTSAETAALSVGQWWIHINASDADEDDRTTDKLYVAKGWI